MATRLRRPPSRSDRPSPGLTGTGPQYEFWSAPSRYRAFVGGVGSGKTLAGAVECLRRPAGSVGMVLAPTYPMLRDATLRTFLDFCAEHGIRCKFHRSELRAEANGSTVLFRSADNPDRLRGPNLGWFWLDEAAMMPAEAWLIMLGRLRESPGLAWVTTTPRGKNWLYQTFVVRGGPDHRVIRAPSGSNPHLPAEFVPALLASYGATFGAQEVRGEFVDDSQEQVLPDSWLDAASAARHRPDGPRRMAIDLAEGGPAGDPAGVLVRDDNGVLHASIGRYGLEAAATRAALLCDRYRVEPGRITYDAGGIGSDFGNRLAAVGLPGARRYKGGASGGDNFRDLRTASAWQARQRLDPRHYDLRGGAARPRTPFAWPGLPTQAREELAALRYTIEADRRKALEPKAELAAALGRSPTWADLLIMSFAYPFA